MGKNQDIPPAAIQIRGSFKSATQTLRDANIKYRWEHQAFFYEDNCCSGTKKAGTNLLYVLNIITDSEQAHRSQKITLNFPTTPRKDCKIPVRDKEGS